ncbi:BZ3500_MvSof-1268-A1-R1_Chr3-1g05994 [Microbotryum saponariae]|uniref:BZ3500_MvSof-1268-A1-R1_Chr3-1g05994 protein n=1 Tax=Microbotryum saponariae TaxID=289078 RepID=A0A2X0MXV8_9BASI|nr:BZ3500_MvSof-1268-A1-R1_Chr3-1g05994 [Microbotryum saponariae]SDA05184.1 BZ3501_MvSof-1269-A2-R1_Chr3-1g05664 [Microbotryum saponariae]
MVSIKSAGYALSTANAASTTSFAESTGSTAHTTGMTSSLVDSPVEDSSHPHPRSAASIQHEENIPLLGNSRTLQEIAEEPVFPLVHRVASEIVDVIDTVLSYDQLKSPTINFSLVRPLTLKLSRGDRPPSPLIYALLVCRVHFLAVASDDLAFLALNTTRADLCELLAVKMLSVYGNQPTSYDLLHVLTASFNPYQGATQGMFEQSEGVDEDELKRLYEWGQRQRENALELGIFSEAKRFVRSPLVQQVVRAIYKGEVLYAPPASRSIIKDDYKAKPVVTIYDWRTQPFLDHALLRVPQIRNRLEFFSFGCLMILFLVTLLTHSDTHIKPVEALFIFFALGFALDEFASVTENGLTTYSLGAYNVMDAVFCAIFFLFLGMRLHGLWIGDEARSEFAFATLSLGGCILFPRLTISLLRDNVVLLALSAMVQQFLQFMILVAFTASGFVATFYVLAKARGAEQWDVGHISWLLLKIWLGNSFLGFEAAQQFDPYYGPALVVAFAVLSQTLLLTILISLLSNTFAAVQGNAETELLNQMALRTIERVKSDALTSYVAPLNLVAFVILYPSRKIATPRYLHKGHVALTKVLNLPVLLALAILTRARHHQRGFFFSFASTSKRVWRALPLSGSWVGWESTVDGVGNIFEREVTSLALRVESIDKGDEEGEHGEGEGEGRGRGAMTTTPPTTTTDEGKTTPTSTPKQPTNGQARRSESPRSRQVGPSKRNSRIGSLQSPLARMFDVTQGQTAGTKSGSKKDEERKGDAGKSVVGGGGGVKEDGEITKRLDAIEAALAILVGELVKNSEGSDEVKRPPLTSLTGAVEQDYSSKD